MASIYASPSSNSIYVQVNDLDTSYGYTDRYCCWYVMNLDDPYSSGYTLVGTSSLGAYASYGGGFTITGLSASTNYAVYVTITNSGQVAAGNQPLSVTLNAVAVTTTAGGSGSGTTDTGGVQNATISIVSVGPDYVNVCLSGMDASYSKIRYCQWYKKLSTSSGYGEYIGTTTLYAGYSQSDVVKVSELSVETYYNQEWYAYAKRGLTYTITAVITVDNITTVREIQRNVAPTGIEIVVDDITSNSIQAHLFGLGDYYYGRTAYWYRGSTYDGYQSIAAEPVYGASDAYTFDGLSEGVEYPINVRIDVGVNGGVEAFSVYPKVVYVTTLSFPAGTTDSTAITIQALYPDSVTVCLSGLNTSYTIARDCLWYADGVYVGTESAGATSSSSDPIMVTGLTSGASVVISVTISDGTTSKTFTRNVTPTTAAIVYQPENITQTTAPVYMVGLYGLPSGCVAYWYIGATSYGQQGLGTIPSTGISSVYTLTGLTAGKTYTVSVMIQTAEYPIYPLPIELTTKRPLIVKWDWSKQNWNASAAQTQTAYTAITSKGKLSDFSYVVWNDLVYKVNECVEATNSTWAGKATAEMTWDDKAMTAARFNAVRSRLGLTDPSAVKGYSIYGSYFITLTTALNNWIDTINAS